MERIINSVKQITDECTAMIASAADTEYVDVKSLGETLNRELQELNTLYDEHPEMDLDIASKKSEVEATAINLEFYLDIRMGLYTERRQLRNFAAKFYNDLKDICAIASRTEGYPDAELVEWYTRAKWALGFYARSQHIIFECDDEDNKKIEFITKCMNEFVNEKGAIR